VKINIFTVIGIISLLTGFTPWISAAEKTIAKDEAEQLFASHKQSIFQIRVIELATGNKAAIGSGFLVDNQGHIATNFHVVSNFVHQPKRYKLEYATVEGVTGELTLIDIDVIHDLAITKSNITKTVPLSLSNKKLSKGTRIFSLGNPHDLGLSVVEGTYNGFLEKSLFDKIFISGSLNPGMSGGPTLDHSGRVIGINVSTAGNQLSFLVPVKFLKPLIKNIPTDKTKGLTTLQQRIEQQLLKHQKNFLTKLIEAEWETTELGPFKLPGSINSIFKCWGDSDSNEDALMEHAYSNCYSEDQIYLEQNFTTGGMAYTYDLYRSKDLSSLHFYNLYSTEFGRTIRVNSVKKEQLSNYTCHVDFVNLAEKDWKISTCARQYLKFPALFDVATSIALVSEKDVGLIVQFVIAGVSKDISLQLTHKFLSQITWQK
jgi:hypothetical protein